jgi:serine protease Do
MRAWLSVITLSALLAGASPAGHAQDLGELFAKINASVVVIKATGREATVRGLSQFGETGSGVLVSPDGKVMTAAHVVHTMETISVQFLGGETVSARVVSSEPAADLSVTTRAGAEGGHRRSSR